MRKFVPLVLVVVFGWSSAAFAATTITFDSLPTGIITPFTESGYSITWAGYPNNTYAQAIENIGGTNQNVVVDATSNSYGTALLVTRVDGGAFNLISLDIANLFNSSSSIAMRISYSNGPDVDYFPNSATFTTVSASLTDITWLEIDAITYGGNKHSFDNIVLSSVPEPTTALLLTLGLAGLGMRRGTFRSSPFALTFRVTARSS